MFGELGTNLRRRAVPRPDKHYPRNALIINRLKPCNASLLRQTLSDNTRYVLAVSTDL